MKENLDTEVKRKRISFSKSLILIILIILVSIVLAKYLTDEEYRIFFDSKILKKEVSSETLKIIDLDSENNPSIYAYSKYIAVLSKSQLKIYNENGKLEKNIEINIASPLMATSGDYLIIGEEKGNKLFLISKTDLIWQTEIDGEISRVAVNANGYSSIITENKTYKSIIISYSPEGKEMFKKYLWTKYATCLDISSDNKYLAIGEVDYSGTIIKSNVEIISIALTKTDPNNSCVYNYESEIGEVLTGINYKNKNYAVCMFTTYIEKISESENSRFYTFNKNTIFSDISLRNNVALIEKQSSGLFSFDYQMKIKGINGKSENLYILNNSMPKSIICYGNKICINSGTEVQIVGLSGFVLKNYTSKNEIKNVVIADKVAGIVFKDRIEIINL